MDERFTGVLERTPGTGGWTYVVWPEAATVLGTRGAAKLSGTIDGHPFRSSIMAMGDGRQMLPVKAEIRKAIRQGSGRRGDGSAAGKAVAGRTIGFLRGC